MAVQLLKNRSAIFGALLFCISLMTSCSAGTNSRAVTMGAGAQPRDTASSAPETASAGRTYGVTDEEDSAKLQRLWVARTAEEANLDYPIGPGDVLEINAQYVDELKGKTVQVEGDGTIDLPLLGSIRAAGLSQKALSREMVQKLRKYVYDPEVDVFVQHYHSHQVAVVGAVKNPGLVILSDSQETVLDMLKQAGGTTADAGGAVILFPGGQDNAKTQANPSGSAQTARVARTAAEFTTLDAHPEQVNRSQGTNATPQDLQPVIIPLGPTSLTSHSISFASTENFLRMPVRPGDLVLVPGGGEVMIIGWVHAPGRFRVSPGLTVLEAIAAAGGTLYTANQSDVRLIRTDISGAKQTIQINVAAIKEGKAEDPAVFPNDVIEVPVSKTKLVPYMLYTLVTRTGMGIATGPVGMAVGGGGGYY
jgi:protein involved in polysaccharide export with SLBB domain